jgi:bifunctional diaminopimelate decarboxylase / aspartate kinase
MSVAARAASAEGAWVVLKFGGTSVSNRANWERIAAVVRARLATGARVMVVHSAITGITDRLEKLLAAALANDYGAAFDAIDARHRQLVADLGLEPSPQLLANLAELRQVAAGIALMGEVSDRVRARVMAMGELMATEIGAGFLQAQDLAAHWLDARSMLRSEERRDATERASYLSATCSFAPDPELEQRLDAFGRVVITQGFIASDAHGATVLLGRGGSDTSAAYLAAKLRAARLEIWTDVPGMFSANPRSTPAARQLRALSYEEAQEIATAGAKVLHPRCILPARQYQIPLYVYATQSPELEGTLVSAAPGNDAAQVKAVCIKKGITLISLDSPGMWHEVGFLSDAFAIFKQCGMSVDLVSTSETTVTVSLDPQANTLDQAALDRLVEGLSKVCRVQVIGPCASVSLVGRNIRAILHQLGDALALFEEQRIYLVSQAANDLNFTFVVDEEQGDRLVEELHELLVAPVRAGGALGPTWDQLMGRTPAASIAVDSPPWWALRRAELLAQLEARDACYVYDTAVVTERATAIRSLPSLGRALYAMKANPHPALLRAAHDAGLGIECVSRGEIEAALTAIPALDPATILYTPNFAPRAEYEWALARGVQVTVDNLYVLSQWPDLFAGRSIFARIDPGSGRGHHQHVRTGGTHSKFGIPAEEADELAHLARAAGAEITGLHAHVGSGIFDVDAWARTAEVLRDVAQRFPHVRVLDLGGGLGVPDRGGKQPFELDKLEQRLAALRRVLGPIELWLEPGRYIVAEAGVLLARVTQLKSKGDVRYVGIATGMNSLIRPALYGAYHEIHNLSRLDEPATELVNIVGPICETGDYLGHDRLLPLTREGDVLLIATAGAYGAAMSSRYNLREPAFEIVL